MKEVLNISISRISFTIELDAFDLLNNYLNDLKRHYGEQEKEVVDDIEERIAELLIEMGCKNSIVNIEQIEKVIEILGKPSDIEDSSNFSSESNNTKKVLYRDVNNKVIGGVCSGLAAYLNMDVVWVRLLYILLSYVATSPFFFRHFFGFNFGFFGFMVLSYIILMIIIPPAKTISQRCAMRGESAGIDQIQKKVNEGIKNVSNDINNFNNRSCPSFFKTLGRAIEFVVGLVLTFFAISGLITGCFLLLGIDFFNGISPIVITDYVNLNITNTFWLKLLWVITLALPLIGILYSGIKLCFNFKTPKWRPGLILFFTWLTCLVLTVVVTIIAVKPYCRHDDFREETTFEKSYDTLYVSMPKIEGKENSKMYLKTRYNNVTLAYVNKLDKDNLEFIYHPKIYVYKDENISTPKVVTYTDVFSSISIFDECPSEVNKSDILTIKDSLITVKPVVYSKENKFNGVINQITIWVPENTKVVIKDPIDYTFRNPKRRYY